MKILIVDDEKNIRELLSDYLENENYETVLCKNGREAVDYVIENNDVQLMLLDVIMPEMDGFETLEIIREYTDVPVLFLTALGDVKSELKGLELGADDYISKPFTYDILMARIKLCLRRANLLDEYVFDNIKMNMTNKSLKIENKTVDVTTKEFELLHYLIKNRGIILERLSIIDQVWGFDFEGDPRTLDTHIKKLRSKLGQTGDRIITKRGVGYYFK